MRGVYEMARPVVLVPYGHLYASMKRPVCFSPRLHCPLGWTIAGVAIGGPGITGDEGVFSGPHTRTTVRYDLDDIFSRVLDPGETGVWCCSR